MNGYEMLKKDFPYLLFTFYKTELLADFNFYFVEQYSHLTFL